MVGNSGPADAGVVGLPPDKHRVAAVKKRLLYCLGQAIHSQGSRWWDSAFRSSGCRSRSSRTPVLRVLAGLFSTDLTTIR